MFNPHSAANLDGFNPEFWSYDAKKEFGLLGLEYGAGAVLFNLHSSNNLFIEVNVTKCRFEKIYSRPNSPLKFSLAPMLFNTLQVSDNN